MNTVRPPRWSTGIPVAALLLGVISGRPAVRVMADEPAITATSLEMPAVDLPAGRDAVGSTAAGRGATPALLPGPRPLADWRALAAVGGCFIVLIGMRSFLRRQALPLPPDVFEVLGSAPLAGPHAVRIVRFGPKTLLVGVSSSGCTTLAEITDPQATACIAAACRGAKPPRVAAGVSAADALKRVTAACLLAILATTSTARAEPAQPIEPAEPPDAATAVVTDAAPAAVAPAAVAPAAVAPAAVAPAAVMPTAASPAVSSANADGLRTLLGPDAITTILPSALLFGVVSLVPAVLLMTTCFVRISVVLALLRQGLGTPQIPSNQILAALAIFLSALVMWPVWTQAWRDGVEPYRQGSLTPAAALERGSLPVRRWMATQIEAAGNRDTMLMFLARHPSGSRPVTTYDDVPVESLLPAFLVSELETAFAIGFRLLLPFLVLDLLVATLVVSTGLVMLPPTLVSLPLKLLVFIAADGWTLVVQSLLDGVRTAAS
jgi:flagellar biosynthesis protein FliP